MIILRSERDEIYNLFTKSKHIIGRNGNLELDDDKSVSRQHAAIYLSVKDKKVQIKLQDLGSKYGTYINDTNRVAQIASDTPKMLKIGDKVSFGKQWNTWKIEESQFVVCASMLSSAQKQALTKLLKPINGILVSDWSDVVSHLTMNEVTITMKVIQALGRVKPIVSLEYWSVLADVLRSVIEEPLPDCDDYIPPLAEPKLASTPTDLSMICGRRILFKNMKFVACTTSQYNKVSSMVTPAGGTAIDGTRTAFNLEDFEDGNIIVLESDTFNKRNQKLVQLLQFLEIHKQRRIPESEIGMSLILNSRDTYCNPKRDPEFVSRQSESQVMIKEEDNEDEVSILDLETQDDVDEESNTQYIDSDSSKFSLAVCDERDDENEDLVVIHDTPEAAEPVVQRSSAKRKREDNADPSNSKNIKMMDWVKRKPSKKRDISSQSPSEVVENKKKPGNNLFAFNREKKPTERSLNSLFKTPNPPTSSSSSADSTDKRKRSSLELFSPESPAPPAKKANVEKRSLFQLPSTSRTTRTGSLILFDSDSVDSPSQKPSKLKTTSGNPNKENSPTDVPKSIIKSDLIDSAKNNVKGESMKEESDDMPFDRKDSFNESLILTIPLVKPRTPQRQTLNISNSSAVNFKKFRKNNGINHTRVIPTNELVVYTCNLKLNDDPHPSNYSDSD